MAILTQNDRRSVGMHPTLTIDPVPDGTIDAQDRSHMGFLFRGAIMEDSEMSQEGHATGFSRTLKTPGWLGLGRLK